MLNTLAIALISAVANAAALFYIPSKPLLEDPVACLQITTTVLFVANLVTGTLGYEAKQGGSVAGKAATLFLATCATIAGIVIIHTAAILFGAPLIEKFKNTLMFAIYLSLLTVFPATCVLKTDPDTWLRVFAEHRPASMAEKFVYFPTVFSIIGAWLGAMVLPLDWDRPWQAWPISCVIGAFLGHSLGLVAGTIASYLHINEDSKRAGKKRSE